MSASDQRRHAAQQRERLFWRTASMFTRFGFTHLQLRLLAAVPMDCERDIASGLVVRSHNIGNQCAQQLLTRSTS